MPGILQRAKEKLPDQIENKFDAGVQRTSGFLSEFKKFAVKGNAIDLAIGVVIGAAFKSIVDSIVADFINPIIGVLTGRVNFANLYINLSGGQYDSIEQAREAGALVITYGNLISATINFLIISLVIFIVIRYVNKLTTEEEEKPIEQKPKVKKCPYCLEEVKINATRCKYCTQIIPLDKEKTTEKVKKIEEKGKKISNHV